MTKLNAGIFSLGASGRLGPDIVLTRHGQTTIARRFKPPLDAQSVTQLLRRALFQDAVWVWHQQNAADKEYYRALDPDIGTNAAYLNFMKEWLVPTVPDHAPNHEAGGSDPLAVENQDSSTVGVSDEPLLNFVVHDDATRILSLVASGSLGWTNLDISPWVPAEAEAVLLGLYFRDSGSAGVGTLLDVQGVDGDYRCWVNGNHINNVSTLQHAIITQRAGGFVQYRVIASGGNTATVRIFLLGWWEPAEV